jgi:hypothetical protein
LCSQINWSNNTIDLDIEVPTSTAASIDTTALATAVGTAVQGEQFAVAEQGEPWQSSSTTAIVPFVINATSQSEAATVQAAENLAAVQFSVSLGRRSAVTATTFSAQVFWAFEYLFGTLSPMV